MNATEYDLGVRDLSDNSLVVNQRVQGSSFVVTLRSDRQYRWNVAACNAAGCSSFSTPLHFNTLSDNASGSGAGLGAPFGGLPAGPSFPNPGFNVAGTTPSRIDTSGMTASSFARNNLARTADARPNNSDQRRQWARRCVLQDEVLQDEVRALEVLIVGAQLGPQGVSAAGIYNDVINIMDGSADVANGRYFSAALRAADLGLSHFVSAYTLGAADLPLAAARVAVAAATAYVNGFATACSGQFNVVQPDGPMDYVLEVFGFEQDMLATTAPYTADLQLTGNGLQQVHEIRWSWTGPNSSSSVWRRGDQNWARYTVGTDGRSARIRPVLVAPNDPPGHYRWSVTFVDRGQQVTRTFSVMYTPSGTPSPPTTTPAGRPTTPSGAAPGSGSAPGQTTNGASVRLSWSASSGATYYDLGVRDLSSNQLVESRQVNGTSFSANLSAGRQYRWNVAACNASGCSSFTAPLYFSTPNDTQPSTPAGGSRPATPGSPSPGSTSSPGQTMNNAMVRLSWNSVPGATSYDLGVRDMTNDRLAEDRRVSGTSFTANLSEGRRYRWNVAACNDAGCSSFTSPLYFTTPGGGGGGGSSRPSTPNGASPGSTSSPGQTTSSRSVRLNWNSVAGATYYDLGVRDMTTNTLVEDRRVNGASFTANLVSGRRYRWNVAACNDAGCSSFTTPLYFTTP